MKNIAYLCSQVTIPGSPNRRSDAIGHDIMLDAIRPEFEARGLRLVEVCWDDQEADWSQYDAAIIGTTWDYWDRHDQFLDTLETIESRTILLNSSAIVRWNANKQYLKELAAKGVKLIPTQWIDEPTVDNIKACFDVLQCDDMVIKQQVGAGADGQHRLSKSDTIPDLCKPMMAQPFLPSIQSEGELSIIYIDGKFSHALIKRAKPGDYRIQSAYGGTEQAVSPSADDLSMAAEVLAALNETPLYARVDMLRAESGELYLMELELIEPYLFPEQGSRLGSLIAEAVQNCLAT